MSKAALPNPHLTPVEKQATPSNPEIPTFEPQTSPSELETPTFEPGTLTSEPETSASKLETPTFKPGTSRSEHRMSTLELHPPTSAVQRWSFEVDRSPFNPHRWTFSAPLGRCKTLITSSDLRVDSNFDQELTSTI